jgi:diguanylate cyclase (GGDEF)-like protein/PAS domain S-box-containing protein
MPEEKDFFKDIIDNLYDGVYFVDRDRIITYWNKGAERITGYSAEHAVGRSCQDNLLNHVTPNGFPICGDRCPLSAVMNDGKAHEVDVYLHHADGHRIPVSVRATALRDDQGNIVGAIETFTNSAGVVNSRQEMKKLRHMVMTDPLTGVGNRRLIEGRLNAVVAEYKSNANVAGLLFLDVDHFKRFNDTYGHNTGDKVLKMVAKTLHHSLRTTDMIGRWGGEEFVAILYDVADLEGLRIVADKVRSLVEYSRIDEEDQSFSVTVSVGATLLLPEDTPESFIARADQLMYASKQAGRNRVTVG